MAFVDVDQIWRFSEEFVAKLKEDPVLGQKFTNIDSIKPVVYDIIAIMCTEDSENKMSRDNLKWHQKSIGLQSGDLDRWNSCIENAMKRASFEEDKCRHMMQAINNLEKEFAHDEKIHTVLKNLKQYVTDTDVANLDKNYIIDKLGYLDYVIP